MANRREYEMLFKLSANSASNFNSTFGSAKNTILQLQNQINALNKAQGDIAAYQRQQQYIEATRKKLEVYQQQLANVQKEMSGAEGYSSALANKELELQARIEKTTGTLSGQTEKLNQMGSSLSQAGVDLNNLSGSADQLNAKINDLKQEEEAAAEEAMRFGDSSVNAIEDIKQALVAAGIAKALEEIFEYYAACAEESMEFESAMTGVAKTTELTDKEFAAMSEHIKDMSEDIPATTTELAAIAETAGQLGVEKDSLLDFTEIMAMLGTATNMTAEEAATMLAQFASITGMDPSRYMNLGSTVVELGNNYATTERNIADMSQTIAAAGSIAGMSEADILGISAAVTSLGISAQNGGTQMTKLISDINSAVSSGEGLSAWAMAAGMTADDFAKAWGTDAAGALNMFIRGLNSTYEAGGDVYGVLNELGITETRMVTMITSLAKSGTRLTDTLSTANTAWAENNALTTEAEKRYATTQSKLILMQNAYDKLQVAIGDEYNPALQKAYEIGAQLFDGIAEFVQKNPGAVKAITALTIALAVFAGGLVAYTLAVKVAAAMTDMFTKAMSANPIFLAVTAVVALTAGIAALAASCEDATPSVYELTEASREMSEVAEEAEQTYEDSVTSIDAAAAVADRYITKLEDLEAAGLSTNEQQKEYHNTLALLSTLVPDLADSIDLQTDSINGGTEALRNNTAAWRKNAVEQAYQEKLTAIYEKYAGVLLEAETNSIKLTEAETKLAVIGPQMNDLREQRNKMMDEAIEKAKALNNTKSYAFLDYLPDKYYELGKEINGLQIEYGQNEVAVRNYTQAIAEDEATLAKYEDEITLTEKAVGNLTEAETAAAAEASEFAEKEAAVNEVITDTETKIQDLITAYGDAYDAAMGSVQGQYDLWDKADTVVATSTDTINANLDSQTKYWKNYNANLSSLADRTDDIEGLREMIASFADGSPESVNAIAGMAAASDEKLTAMVGKWQALQTEQGSTASSLAELETDFTDSMNTLLTEMSNTVDDMDMSGEASTAAIQTVTAYINSIEDGADDAYAAAKRVAAAAASGFASGQGSSGQPDGYASGTMSAEPGWSWVGEEGPELMYMHGGEAIYPADDSADMAIRALESEDRYSGGLGGITIKPVYNITVGSDADADNLREVIAKLNEDLGEMVIEKIEDYLEDKKRGAYT